MNDLRPHHALTIVGYIMPAAGLLLWLNHALATAPRPVINNNKTAITSNGAEYGELLTSTGEKWGLVKLWNYSDNPALIPNTDLKSIVQAQQKGYRVIILESHDNPPVLGWRIENGQLLRNTPEIANQYPEIFKDSIKPR